MAGWPAGAPTLAPPRRLGARAALVGAVTTAFLRARQLLEALKGMRREQQGAGGGPEGPSEDHSKYDSIWDDPELWMFIMMH